MTFWTMPMIIISQCIWVVAEKLLDSLMRFVHRTMDCSSIKKGIGRIDFQIPQGDILFRWISFEKNVR